MKYKVNLKKTEEGYAVWVPELPGCQSQGQTEKEALENIKDVIKTQLVFGRKHTKAKQNKAKLAKIVDERH